MGKTDYAWDKLFTKYNIVNKIDRDGQFIITADQIKEFREPRLATKFDHYVNLPQLFKNNDINILPITRGSYVLSRFQAYSDLSYSDLEPTPVSIPSGIESINASKIYSEAAALNAAFTTGMLNDFLDEDLIFPTVSGRMSSDSFDFNINHISGRQIPITVTNSQIEIDGGYEGERQLMLIEAKNSIASDFLIRQLYYPYRLWQSKIQKQVIPVFVTFSNDVFSLFQFDFIEPDNYNSLQLVKQKNYVIAPDTITLDDIISVYNSVILVGEPRVSYPQADTFTRVINLLELLMVEDLERDYLTQTLDVHNRQTNYYTSAGMYLGLITKYTEGGFVYYTLTQKGRDIMSKRPKEKYLSIVKCILQNVSFHRAFGKVLELGVIPGLDVIVEIMETSNIYNVDSHNTYERRALTVRKWLEWILELPN